MTNSGPPARDHDGGARLSASGFARLIASGLLERRCAAIRQGLCRDPGAGAPWMRLANTSRSLGALTASSRAYSHAAMLGVNSVEARALSALTRGDPAPAVALADQRAAPFLQGVSPLSSTILAAVLARRDPIAGEAGRPGLVGMGIHAPGVRDAVVWRLSEPLMTDVLECCRPFATEAARVLFGQRPELADVEHNLIDYSGGGSYRAHVDVGKPGDETARRVLTMVLYLDIAETAFTGGDLLLLDRKGNAVTRIRPRTGLIVAFPSDTVHDVTRRTVLTLWYNRPRPDQE